MNEHANMLAIVPEVPGDKAKAGGTVRATRF
jgi:hypothetical protein